LQSPRILVVKGLPKSGKTAVVEALFAHLTHKMEADVPASILWVDACPSLQLTHQLGAVHPETLTLQQVASLLKRDFRKPGTWVDSLFTEAPQALTAHQDLLTVFSPSHPWEAAAWDAHVAEPWVLPNWLYGWKRLLKKHYQWIVMDDAFPGLLNPLPLEDVSIVWVASINDTWHAVEQAQLAIRGNHLGSASLGLVLNQPTGKAPMSLKPFLPVQEGRLFHDSRQWLGKLPYFLDDTQWHCGFMPAVLQSLQRLPWGATHLLR
jgi:hypothetical protein